MKYLLIAVLAISCTKIYEAPAIMDVRIKHSLTPTGINLESVSYSTTAAALAHIWFVNDVRYEGKTVTVPVNTNRYSIQLAVIDSEGNSKADYLTVVR